MPGMQDLSDDDPSDMVQQSQERIYQLRRDREARLEEAVAQSQAALEDVQSRAEAIKKKKKRQITQAHAEQVKCIIQMVNKRKDIEREMIDVAKEADELTRSVEELMEGGFRGRENDAMRHLEGKAIKQKRH